MFERYYSNVLFNQDHGPYGRQWNRLLDAVVPILKYKKITTDNTIYIKVFSNVTVSCITVFTDGVINTTNNDTEFPELARVLKNTLI